MAVPFRRVLVSDQTWQSLKREHPELRERFDDLAQLIGHFYLNGRLALGKQIRSLSQGSYKIRVTRGMRIPFHFEANAGEVDLCFGDLGDHAQGEAWHRVPPQWIGVNVLAERYPEVAVEVSGPRPPMSRHQTWRVLDDAWRERLAANPQADLRLLLSPEQERIAALPGPVLLQGGAGSGKTTIALYRLASNPHPSGARLYLTYTPELRAHAEELYTALAPLSPIAPRFLSLEALCREILGPEAAERFPPARRMSLPRFVAQFFSRSNAVVGRHPEGFWEEILGVIKGEDRVLANPRRGALTREEYRESPRRSAQDADQVYEVFEAYRRLESWDDVDLAQAAYLRHLEAGAAGVRFTEVIVDEVQDFTAFHLGLLARLSEHQDGVFLAGDTHQAIHPSRFDWTRSRALAYHLWGLRLGGAAVQTLSRNYRCSQPVVAFANALAAWRRDGGADIEASECDSLKSGPPLRRLTPAELPRLPDPERLTTRLMVIVTDAADLEPARRLFGEAIVYSVYQAKGLERDYVLLWRAFSPERGNWERGAVAGERFRLIVNRLNVACTRALEELYLVDDYFPEAWEPLASQAMETSTKAIAGLERLLELPPDDEPMIRRQAQENERLGNWVQAAALHTRLKAHARAARCYLSDGAIARAAASFELAGEPASAAASWEEAGRFREAARCYGQCGMRLDAAKCLRRANAREEALSLFLACGAWAEAGECLEVLKRPLEAARCYQLADRPGDHTRMLLRAGAYVEAATCFAELDLSSEAAIATWQGELQAAAASWRSEGSGPLELADAAEQGDWAAIARHCAKHEGWKLAAQFHRLALQVEQQARCLEAGEFFLEAAERWCEGGDEARMALCLELAAMVGESRWRRIAERYQMVHDSELALRFALRSESFAVCAMALARLAAPELRSPQRPDGPARPEAAAVAATPEQLVSAAFLLEHRASGLPLARELALLGGHRALAAKLERLARHVQAGAWAKVAEDWIALGEPGFAAPYARRAGK